MDFKVKSNKIEKEFERMANQLLLEKQIVVNGTTFNFTEIEFYFYSDNHQDSFTHEHSAEAGKWRFHNQGLDISLSDGSNYGGILIRGIEKINSQTANEFTNGPRRSLFKIMEHLNDVNNLENEFGLKTKKKENHEIFKTFRHGLKNPSSNRKNDNVDKFRNAKYRFIIKPQSFDRKQFAGSEKIARDFNDRVLSEKFLGYNLNK